MGAALLLTAGVALAAQIACKGGICKGTDGDDTMIGTKGHDTMIGKNGSDVMVGRGDNDEMHGGFGAEKMDGRKGNDLMRGGGGPDEISGGPGTDTIEGETGNDTIHVDGDGVRDSVSCGIGPKDTAFVDVADLSQQSFEDFVRLTSCESVIVR